jgi:fibronectin type 3 domain-containing protein
MNKIITLLVFMVLAGVGFGQENAVKLIASPRPDSILLRWAPSNAYTWNLANEYGYLIKRYTIVKGKKVVKEVTVTDLISTPLKPRPLQDWEPFADDKYVSIAAECIFNSTFAGIPVGFNPHFAYKKYKEEQHRFSFALYAADQSLQVATLSGLYFVDKTALPKEKYLYKVFINCPDTLAVDTASAFTGTSEYQSLPKPLDLTAKWGDKKVDLSWNIMYLNHYYNSYAVEKSLDKGKTYHRLSENNAIQLSDKEIYTEFQYKSDTLSNNSDIVYYRVRGISAFGEISPPSDSVFGKGRLPLENAPVIINDDLIDNTLIKLDWLYPDNMNEYITGFKVYRSSKPKGQKSLIYNGSNPAARSFTDSTPSITNYYLISVYNETEENLTPIHTYVARIDSFPPKPPVNFEGTIDSLGGVHLKWSANTEEDIDGYRIYRSNHPDFEFSLVHPSIIRDTICMDSIKLKILDKHVYYRIRAIDVRDNQSGFSEILTLTRPDIIPPVPPVIKNVALNEKNFPVLLWVNSSSSDVVNHLIYRKASPDTVFSLIATLGKGDSIRAVYTDKLATAGKSYTYYVCAQDDSKLISQPSNKGFINIKGNEEEQLKLKRTVYTDKVKLTWNLKLEKPVQKVLVYRSINEGNMQLLGHSNTNEYWDNKLSPEKDYKYSIKVEFTDGSTSIMSKPVSAKM